jgi:hypothetical protein
MTPGRPNRHAAEHRLPTLRKPVCFGLFWCVLVCFAFGMHANSVSPPTPPGRKKEYEWKWVGNSFFPPNSALGTPHSAWEWPRLSRRLATPTCPAVAGKRRRKPKPNADQMGKRPERRPLGLLGNRHCDWNRYCQKNSRSDISPRKGAIARSDGFGGLLVTWRLCDGVAVLREDRRDAKTRKRDLIGFNFSGLIFCPLNLNLV